ncbi:MAG: hypothetical protein ACJ719_00065 [Nitrososphaeraceae archaeon]
MPRTSATLEPERRESRIKQPHRGVQPNESDIYVRINTKIA